MTLKSVATAMFAAASLSLVAVPALASTGECLSAADRNAVQIRQMHVQLMVAALKCDDSLGLRDTYGTYVNKHNSVLSGNAQSLRSLFQKTYGGDGSRQFDRFITRLANDASSQAQTQLGYCESNLELLQKAAALPANQVDDLAREAIAVPADLGRCVKSEQRKAEAPKPKATEKPVKVADASKPQAKETKAKPAAKPTEKHADPAKKTQ